MLRYTGIGLAGTALSGTAQATGDEREEVLFVHPASRGADVVAAARANDGRVVYDYENFDFIAVTLPANRRAPLRRDPRVGFVEDDGVVTEGHHDDTHSGGNGTEKGGDDTEGTPPSVTTLEATGIEAEHADLRGDLTDLGGASEVAVHFDARSTSSETWTVVGERTRSEPGTFEQGVSLWPNVEYEFRAVAENSDGTDTGEVLTFSTPSDHPEQEASWGHDRVFGNSEERKSETYSVATGSNVDIAILDGGIQRDHDDLVSNLEGGVNFTADGSSWADDDTGHGTHVGGIAGAADDGIGTIGVAPEANLWSVKVLHGGSGTWSDIIAGIDWCIENDREIISMSLGSDSGNASVADAIATAYAEGHLVVTSAGNNGNDDDGSCAEDTVRFPGWHEDTVAVAAMDPDETIASYSSVGPDVELLAPGTGITAPVPEDEYAEKSGTSMAAPFASGAAALAWDVFGAAGPNPDDRDRIRTLLRDEAESVLGTCEEGEGLVNAANVVTAAAELADDPDDGTGDDPETGTPEIAAFAVSWRENGPWTRADVEWSVIHSEGTLATVISELLDGDTVIDSQRTDVSGSSAVGEHELRTRGTGDAVRLTVTDETGAIATETRSV